MLELGAALGQLELRVGALEGSSIAAAQKGGGVKSKGGKRGGRDTNAGGEGNCPTRAPRSMPRRHFSMQALLYNQVISRKGCAKV